MIMRALLVSVALLCASGLNAAEKAEDLARSHARLQQRDQQLLDVGWRLATANAPYCANASPAIGLILQDMRGYGGQADALRRALGLTGDIAVQAVATGSPAAAAGLIANREVLRVDGEVNLIAQPNSGAPAWQRLTNLHDAIDASLKNDGAVSLIWQGGEAALKGVQACPSRFEVLDSGSKAMAEGSRVLFGRDFPGFGYAEDEFAAAVAHELAHNLLAHRAWLAEHGRSRSNIRLTEREADRLMPWLLANAGYDPQAAARFMQRWGPAHGGWIFRKRTHDGWDERAAFIEAEVARIGQVRTSEGRADWAAHFTREVKP